MSDLPRMRTTPDAIRARKGGVPLVCLTATNAPFARLLDPAADLLLVGDSLGVVVYGLSNTLGVTLDMMIAHGAAVARSTTHACVVVDMPFATYQKSPEQAFENAARIMAQTGCSAVKLEGGRVMADTIRFLVDRGIPVMGHIGFLPQSASNLSQLNLDEQALSETARVLADARAIADAGAFSTVVSTVTEAVAREVTAGVGIPTVGVNASVACDGQILSAETILGLFGDPPPAYSKRYVDLRPAIRTAIDQYAQDVRERRFPARAPAPRQSA